MLRRISGIALNPGIYFGVALGVLLAAIAYQVRPTYDIQVGSPTDGTVLQGFHAREVAPGNPPLPFRWTSGASWITLRDVGRQDFDVVLTVNGWRPEGMPEPQLTVEAGGRKVLDVAPAPVPTDYSFSVPRELVRDGTLTLYLSTNAFSPPGDARPLGVGITRVRVEPGINPDRFIEPPLSVLAAIAGAAALIGLILSALGWGVGGVATGTSLVGVLAAGLIAFDRLWFTSDRWYALWPQVAVIGAIFVLLVWLIGSWVLSLGGAGWSPLQGRVLLTLMLAAFVVRLAGQLHPQINVIDLTFHAHRFALVESGQLLFMHVSSEWGGRLNFYLPTVYIFMLPLQWLLHDQYLVIRIVTVGLSTLGAVPIFYVARRLLRDGRAGLIAGALYLSVPMAVLIFSWGVTSNVFGEFFALCAFAVAVGAYPDLSLRRPAFWALLALLFVALLSHPGVVQMVGLSMVVVSLLWVARSRNVAERRAAGWVVAALVVAAGMAYLLYYINFAETMLTTLAELNRERAAPSTAGGLNVKISGAVDDRSLGLVPAYAQTWSEWFFGGLRGFWQEAQAYYRVWPVAGALLGYALIWPGRSLVGWARKKRQARLVLAAAGWLLTVTAFAVVGWAMNLYVRYMLFALPVVALGAGILMSGLWRRGRAGALLSVLALAFFAAEAVALWQYRINYAFK